MLKDACSRGRYYRLPKMTIASGDLGSEPRMYIIYNMATPTGGEAARARAAKPPRVGLFRQHASCHSEMRKSFWGKIWGTRFGIICCVCDTNHCINKLNSPFYMFFKHKLDSVDAYMTIKPHFNRSTTTKTVSRVPVSCEISMWKSHLRETRLHLFFFFFFF